MDFPEYVSKNIADIGIIGVDMIAECSSDVEPFLDLEFGYIRLVFVVSEKSSVARSQRCVGDSWVFQYLQIVFFICQELMSPSLRLMVHVNLTRARCH
ncbi:MAG: hypothetical protein LBH02_00690 [Methanocalculaceae archaeon]|nr:hypothetical protein [Methanocalculaceae archaeon]